MKVLLTVKRGFPVSLSFFMPIFIGKKQGEKNREVLQVDNNISIGQQFGHLTVLKLHNKDHHGSSWLCKCDCGKEIVLGTCHLMGNKTRRPNRSCGCSQKRLNGKCMEYPRIYRIWKHMIYRCTSLNETGYERYGGKGVTVCEEWTNSFDSFLEWALNNGYSDVLTIYIIDSTKPYQPDNCRWATYFTQEQNRGVQKRNKLGILGVCSSGKGYRAYISRDGVKKHLGWFKTIDEATNARKQAEEKYLACGQI
jgi:hypothetical protein